MSAPRGFLCRATVTAKGCCPCPVRDITASLGDTVLLPCSFTWEPEKDNVLKVCWEKKLGPGKTIQVHSQMVSCDKVEQDDDYVDRTSLTPNWDKDGKGTLELRDIKASDNGVYTFWLGGPNPMCCEVNLTVVDTVQAVEKGD